MKTKFTKNNDGKLWGENYKRKEIVNKNISSSGRTSCSTVPLLT
jgi:hypothetical protein